MPNPYNRTIKTPAEQKADSVRASFEKAMSPEDVKTWQQENFAVADPMFHATPTDSPKFFEQAMNPPYAADPMFNVDRADPSFQAPKEQEAPWYADLPHVPGVSQAGAAVRDTAMDLFSFGAEASPTIMGGLREGVGSIFGEKGADIYGKYWAGGYLGSEPVQEALEKQGDLGASGPLGGVARAISWFTEDIDTKKGFSNEVIKEIAENPDADPRDIYRMVIDAHEARPMRQQLLLGALSPDIVLPVGGVVSKLAKGVKISGQTTKALVANSLKLNKAIDPESMRYRHTESVGPGQKQVIIVSHSAPEGRRVTVQAGTDAQEALESAAKIGLEDAPAYKILPADANRIEVAQALGSLGAPVERIGREALEQWAGKPVTAGHTLRPRRADIPEEYIVSDTPAFAGRGLTDVDRMEVIERFWRAMPKEFQGIGDEVLPTDAYKTGRKIPEPIVRKINAPSLLPDLFGDRELLHVVDNSTGLDEVIAVMEIRRVGAGEGAEVVAFYPTVKNVGPGTFGADGIKNIVRQVGDIYPYLNNMDFAGKLLREGQEAGAEGFTGTAAESMAQRLGGSDISDDAADAVNAGFPRASSVDAERMADPGLSGQRALAGVTPSATHTGYHHTIADRINEVRGMEALTPEDRAVLGNVVWPIRPGELLFDMADYGSHNILFDKPGLTNTLATWVPGSGKVMGVWNRAQLEQFDPIKAIGHEVELFKDIEKSRVRTAVLAWRAAAYPVLGFKQIRSKWDMVNNRQGVWRAEKVVGYDEKKVLSPSSVHGTIDDIIRDMDEVRQGIRVPSQLVNGVEKVPPGKKKQIYFLTEEQESHIKMAQDMMEQNLRRNQEAGVDVIAIQTSYWHRMVLKGPKDKNDSALKAALDEIHEHNVALSGAKKGYQYNRAFDHMDELDKGGFVWETDPAARMLARLDAGIETFAHKKAYDKVLNLKTPEGRAFLTRRERLGTLKEGSKETGLYVTEGPTAIKALNAARILRVEGRKIYKRDPSPENELAMRRADAQFLTAYRNYRAADARANKNYFEATLNGKINDRALIDEIYENVHIPQVQNARMAAGKGGGESSVMQYGAESMQLFRAMMTNVDLAAMGIQGQTLIYRDPASWFTAVKESVRAIVKEPEAWIKKNREFLDEGQSVGAILRPTEWMFDPTGIASIPTRIPLFGPAFRGFQRSFEWFIIVGQTELYKSVRSSKLLKGVADRDEFIPLQSEEALQAMVDAGKAIRRELGTENMAILGIRPSQRTFEQLAFFASRFMRANIGLVALALRPTRLGGKTGLRNADSIEAKRALLSMLGGGTAMLVGTHYALTGRAPNVHDPFAPDWFQIPIGRTYYNFMGPLYPYFRAVAQAAQRTKEGDPGAALEIAGRFLNSKAGIPFRLMGITGEMLVTGEARTFEGDVIDPSLKGVGTAAMEFSVPLSVTGVADALSEGRYEATLSEVFGLTGRAHPNAQMDILFQRHINDPNHDLYKERVEDEIPTGGTWYDASPYEQKWMEETYKSIAADILQSGRGDYGEASRQFHALDTEYIQKQEDLAKLLYKPVQGQPTVDGSEFRSKLEDLQRERYAKHDKIVKDYDLFTEPPKIKSQQEQDLYDYHQVFANSKDAAGNIKWATLDEEMAEFEERVGDKRLEYILKQTGLNNSNTVRQLRNDKRELQEVWDHRDDYVKTFPLDIQLAYYEYRDMPVVLQRQANPAIQNIANLVSQESAIWLLERDRAGDKTAGFLEEKLVYWGYETTPFTEAGIEMLKKINADLGFEGKGMDPRVARPDRYPEVFGGQKEAANGAGMSTEETSPLPPWLQQATTSAFGGR